MVFGLFSRKSHSDTAAPPDDARLPTPTPSVASVARHSPFRFPTVLRSALGGSTTDLNHRDSDLATDSVAEGTNNADSVAPLPPATPSPPPTVGPDEARTLYDLVLAIPPRTLHAYTLAHLRPPPPPPSSTLLTEPASHPDDTPRPPSPNTTSKLAAFFSTLAPPPLLHCARCHKDFYDVENEEKDKACRVPHDDESALVSRVSGGGYETLWGCCGQTAPGDGSEGPPDGWCYEGRHTTDVKRARFRADSTLQNDKLTSCLRLNCRGIRDRLQRASPLRNAATTSARRSNPSPARSQTSLPAPRSARKRPRPSFNASSGSEHESDRHTAPAPKDADEKPTEGAKGDAGRGKSGGGGGGREREKGRVREDEDSATTTDDGVVDAPKPKAKVARSRPVVRVTASASPAKATSRALLRSQSRWELASDSEASTRIRPRTRSQVLEEPRGRTAVRRTRAATSERAGRSARKASKVHSRSLTPEEGLETEGGEESDQEARGRARKKRRVTRA